MAMTTVRPLAGLDAGMAFWGRDPRPHQLYVGCNKKHLYGFCHMRYNALVNDIGEAYRSVTGRKWLHCITPIDNVESIVKNGLLSHNGAKRYSHIDVSMREVQELRSQVIIERSRRSLHDYANLYFNARNTMMYYLKMNRKDFPESYCVLAVDYDVLGVEGVIVSDMNAAISLARFDKPREMLGVINFQRVFADSWNHPDEFDKRRHRGEMCAEVLVPNRVDTEYIHGAYVNCAEIKERMEQLIPKLPIGICPKLFFC